MKIKSIKINSKKEDWIQSFEAKVDDYTEKEDFFRSLYKIPKGKHNGYVFKGRYLCDLEEIIFIMIYCERNSRAYNTVVKFQGSFEVKEEELYLTGEVIGLYPNYIKEFFTFPGIFFLIPFFMIGLFIEGLDAVITYGFLIIAFIIASYILPRLEVRGDKKKIIQELENIH